jgi:hypothetical protein
MLDAPRRRFVTYYRVSTDRQGRSGLGLEAQQRGVAEFLAGEPGQLGSVRSPLLGHRRMGIPRLRKPQ